MTQTKYDKAVSVCFSGHRNIPFLYRKKLKLQLKAAITKAYAGGYRHFYCGCAMGVDMLAAEVALVWSASYCRSTVSRTSRAVERCDESPV